MAVVLGVWKHITEFPITPFSLCCIGLTSCYNYTIFQKYVKAKITLFFIKKDGWFNIQGVLKSYYQQKKKLHIGDQCMCALSSSQILRTGGETDPDLWDISDDRSDGRGYRWPDGYRCDRSECGKWLCRGSASRADAWLYDAVRNTGENLSQA